MNGFLLFSISLTYSFVSFLFCVKKLVLIDIALPNLKIFLFFGCMWKGDVDVICGGPPCQGISGFNRFRNVEAPLDDPKNHQMVVYMDIVNFMRPRYVLMENVVDILKFCNGFLGRYALSRLIHMNYQARIGMMAAGCYGLPQFRMRAFLWGAKPSEVCYFFVIALSSPSICDGLMPILHWFNVETSTISTTNT